MPRVVAVAPVKIDQPAGRLVPMPSNVSVYDVPVSVTCAKSALTVNRKAVKKSRSLYILAIDGSVPMKNLMNEPRFGV